MNSKWKKTGWAVWLLALVLVLSACSSDTGTEDADVEHGEVVPDVRIFSSLRDANEANYLAAVDVQKVWEELGISVSLEPQEFNTLINILYSDEQDFDAYTVGWGGRVDRIDPDMFIYSIFHSSNAIAGGNNTTGFMNEAYDRIAEAQRSEMDPDRRQELIHDAQEMLASEAPLLTLYARALYHAYNNERFDNMVMMAGEGMYNEWTPMRATPLTDDKWLKVGSIFDLDTVNPVGAHSTYEWRNLRLIYDKLVRLSPTAEPQPAAAESWEIVDDTTIEVKVREGMSFHDGEPVTAADVKFSYDYYIDWEVGYFMAFLEAIDSVEEVDEYTVRFHLKQPYAPFVGVTMAQIPIIPKHIWENLVEEEGLSHPDEYLNEQAIGSGPFQLDHWRRGQELRASKNPYFYEDIAIDGFIYDIYAQHEGVMTALETRDIDMNAEQFIPAHIERSQQIPHLTVVDAGDIGYQYLSFNMRKPPFDDLAFRQAIAHTVDYDTILDVYLQGYGVKGGAGLVISPDNEFWYKPDVDRPEFDLDAARQILEAAGYTWDDQGRLRLPVE
ncbi:ABC transporter substrate-binding protein [Bacillus horti]|uniref:Peptide/nickel transport system substrate-binding protein n=1 Tax=Caldalkalibacillus horti TaxID=77523 RepID=A0ABT9VV45_9BACI|nr:ABC transporter substrate-binding protein [Bacillus horti]MDQ0164862.1 peptide/nickel transport system substrate-binding protein [Bacillus horti]